MNPTGTVSEPPPTVVDPVPGGRGSSWRPDVLKWLVVALLTFQVFLRVVPEFRPGLGGVVCWLFGIELVPIAAAGLLGFALLFALIGKALRKPFWSRRRAILWGLLVLLSLSGATFRRYPSSFDGRPSRVAFRVPLDGPVTVAWGGGTPRENYHVIAPDQRWAYDLLVTRDGQSHRGEGERLEDYYIYDVPILAPSDGEVVSLSDGDPDMPPGELGGGTTPSGNHVVLKVAPGEYLWLCHMRPGSVKVARGDRVRQGDPIGRVGNSGNTSEPHLHVHLQSTPEPFIAEGIPMPFHRYRTGDGRVVDRGIPTGGIGPGGTLIGQVIEHAGEGTPPADASAEGP